MKLAVLADEVTAAGWRLIGARTHIPEEGKPEQSFRAAVDDADVVLITAREASKLPPAQVEAALRAARPLLLVIADMTSGLAPSDLEQEVVRALGISP